ncbi:MAG: endonuclease domain-containing protein [Clostridia bacterium]|nr:endonuclease domain-containing protein [Clostridia bacterium]
MNKTNNSNLTSVSKILRKNMTKEERHLWYDFLKNLPQTINRQKVIGSYIVDFYCASAKIVIELDGSQHYEDEGKEKDKARDAYLNALGIKVLRYSNLDVNRDFENVCADILRHINTSSVSLALTPSPQGEGGERLLFEALYEKRTRQRQASP